MKNEEPIHIPDFNFVASYKRPEVPAAAGVAIYQHTQDTSHIVTSYMDIHTKFTGIGGILSQKSQWQEYKHLITTLYGNSFSGVVGTGSADEPFLSSCSHSPKSYGCPITNSLS
ncbi:hypothetical protein TNCV_573971 [Trichonephila clavipes]|nr:hypothetical protein TNCV_573971 [Trichonephila clavipes]